MANKKDSLLKFQTITSGDMSQATITSTVTQIQFLDDIGIQFNFTGSPTGTFSVEVSIDYAQDSQGNVSNAGNWVPISFSATPEASGTAGSVFLDIFGLSAPWIRSKYTKISGTGTLNAFICAKAI